jgi:hypothetical protein
MSRENKYAHVVQLRLTREEWRVISQMAWLRRMSVEDILREGLHLTRTDGDAQTPERAAPLRLAGPARPSRARRPRRRP